MLRGTSAIVAALATCALVVPATASANHHACPQLTTTPTGAANQSTNIDVSRKDCSPFYVPYPIGGPKSPLPPGANYTIPFALPAGQINTANLLAAVGVKAGPDDQAFDLLGSVGPDFSQIRPNLGTPQDSDPANPYPPSPLNPLNLTILALPLPKISPLLLINTNVITVGAAGATLTLKTG